MSRARVAHVITRLIVGGAQENTVLSCALVDHQRFESFLLVGPETGSEGELLSEAGRLGVRTRIVPELRRRVAPVLDVRALRALTRLLRDERPDIVHTHSSKAGILGRRAAHRAGVPHVVHTVHGWSFHDHMTPAVRVTWIALERAAARWADRLVVVTERDRTKGLAAGIGRPEQYVTIRSGFDLAPFEEPHDRTKARAEMGIPPSAPVVGAVMRLSDQKDPRTWVAAALRVARLRPDAHFVMVGDGPLRGEVEDAVRGGGLAGRFHLTGIRRDVPGLLGAFDVVLLTSRWEGLPRTVVQAMAAGVPVVATQADGVAEVVRDGVNGLLRPVGDPSPLADAVLELLDDHARAAHLAEQARAIVAEFDLRVMIQQLEQLYTELLQLPASSR